MCYFSLLDLYSRGRRNNRTSAYLLVLLNYNSYQYFICDVDWGQKLLVIHKAQLGFWFSPAAPGCLGCLGFHPFPHSNSNFYWASPVLFTAFAFASGADTKAERALGHLVADGASSQVVC